MAASRPTFAHNVMLREEAAEADLAPVAGAHINPNTLFSTDTSAGLGILTGHNIYLIDLD